MRKYGESNVDEVIDMLANQTESIWKLVDSIENTIEEHIALFCQFVELRSTASGGRGEIFVLFDENPHQTSMVRKVARKREEEYEVKMFFT